jgi:XrtJ-associated TM-motif-TM protein
MSRRFSLLLLFLFAAVALPLHAQSGCTDSPEAPTAALALVGGAGALIARLRLRNRR